MIIELGCCSRAVQCFQIELEFFFEILVQQSHPSRHPTDSIILNEIANSGKRLGKVQRGPDATNTVQGDCFAIKVLSRIKAKCSILISDQVDRIGKLRPPSIVGISLEKPDPFLGPFVFRPPLLALGSAW